MAWLDTDFLKRSEGTIDSSLVDEAVGYVPIYLSALDATFWANVDAAGDDIRVTLADGTTEVAFYIASIDTVGETGLIWADVSGAISTSADTSYYIYYDNAAALPYGVGDTYGRNNVWDANTTAVYMLTGSDRYTDLTGNGFDLTDLGSPPGGDPGPVEGTESIEFDGLDDFLQANFTAGAGPVGDWPGSLEAWGNSDSGADQQSLVVLQDSTSVNSRLTANFRGNQPSDPVQGVARGDGGGSFSVSSTSSGYSLSTWHFATASRDANTGTTTAEIDAASTGTDTTTVTTPVFNRLTIGAVNHTSRAVEFDGFISLVFAHDVVRSSDYFQTRYNAYTAAGFWTWGASEDVPAGDATASGALALGGLTLSGDAETDASGAGGLALGGLTLAGDVSVDAASASGGLSLGGLSMDGTVESDASASGALNLGGLTLDGVSAPPAVGFGALSLGGLTLAGEAESDASASGTLNLGGLTLDGAGGGPGHEGTGNLSLGGLTLSGYGLSDSIGTTDGDSVRVYLTGAVETGEPQRDPESSTGGFRSGVPFQTLEWDMPDPMTGVIILAVSGANGTGTGRLNAVTSGSLSWTPPGGTEGAAVAVANGGEAILYGGDATEWIRVKRTSAIDLHGVKAVQLMDIYNNLLPDVASADAVAGGTETRALMLYNVVLGSVVAVKAWVADSDGTISIAFEAPSSGELDGVGLSYSSPATEAAALNGGLLAGGGELGLFVKRTTPAGADPSGRTLWTVNLQYEDTENTYTIPVRGLYRVARDDYVAQGIWIGVGGDDPDLDADPDEVWTSNPNTTSLTLSSDETYRVAVRARNPYGLWGVPTEIEEFVIDAGGDSTLVPPSGPVDVVAHQTSDNKPAVTALYEAAADGDTRRADLWVIWFETDGTDPDGSGTPDGYEVMEYKAAIDDLTWEDDGSALDDGTPLSMLVRTRRLDSAGTAFLPDVIPLDDSSPGTLKVAAEVSDWPASGYGRTRGKFGRLLEVWSYTDITVAGGATTVTVDARALMGTTAAATNETTYVEAVTTLDSTNTAAATWDIVSVAPGRPQGAMLYGRQAAQFQSPVGGPDGTTPVVIDATENVHFVLGEGWSSLYVATTLVWRCLYHSDDGQANALYIPSEFSIVNASVSGSAVDSGVFDVVDGNTVYVVVNGTRRLLVDLTAMEITVATLNEEQDIPVRAEQAGSLGQFGATLLLVWDPKVEDYRPFAQLTSAGVLNVALEVDNTLNQAAVEALWQA